MLHLCLKHKSCRDGWCNLSWGKSCTLLASYARLCHKKTFSVKMGKWRKLAYTERMTSLFHMSFLKRNCYLKQFLQDFTTSFGLLICSSLVCFMFQNLRDLIHTRYFLQDLFLIFTLEKKKEKKSLLSLSLILPSFNHWTCCILGCGPLLPFQ